jgi:hypothetical protein
MTPEDEEFNRIEREAKQRMAAVQHAIDTASTHEQTYENGFIDGMQHQMRSSVDKAVNRMAEKPFNPDWNNFHDGVAVGRTTAFEEIGRKIKAMPFNDDTIDSLLIWLKEQE